VLTLIGLSEALKTTIALIAIFGVFFPLLVQGLIMFAVSVARGEKAANDERRGRRQ
jgi:K+-transporting ATPase c subunit